jgi:Flp pilus assembly protein TadD
MPKTRFARNGVGAVRNPRFAGPSYPYDRCDAHGLATSNCFACASVITRCCSARTPAVPRASPDIVQFASGPLNCRSWKTSLDGCIPALSSFRRSKLSIRPALSDVENHLQTMSGINRAEFDSLRRAVELYHAGYFDEAESLCTAIVLATEGYFDALHVLAVVQWQLGRLPEALFNYHKAVTINPDHAEAWSNRGVTLYGLKRFEEALSSYDKALAINPDHVEALNNRGNALQQLKRFEVALSSYDKALAIKPDHVEALNNRGLVLYERNRLEEAIASVMIEVPVRRWGSAVKPEAKRAALEAHVELPHARVLRPKHTIAQRARTQKWLKAGLLNSSGSPVRSRNRAPGAPPSGLTISPISVTATLAFFAAARKAASFAGSTVHTIS